MRIIRQITFTRLMSRHELLLFKYFCNRLENELRIKNIASRHMIMDENKPQKLSLECKYLLYAI